MSEHGPAEEDGARRRPGKRRPLVMVAGVILGFGVVAAGAVALPDRDATDRAAPPVQAGGAVASFELPSVRSEEPTVSLASYRGKPVVLNFWASWCVPCRKEMPSFQAVAEKVEGRVAFVGVNHQDSRRLALELLAETGVGYPSGYDPGGKVAAAQRLLGMPTTLFISPEGRILERKTGEMSREELERTLKRLFGAV